MRSSSSSTAVELIAWARRKGLLDVVLKGQQDGPLEGTFYCALI